MDDGLFEVDAFGQLVQRFKESEKGLLNEDLFLWVWIYQKINCKEHYDMVSLRLKKII